MRVLAIDIGSSSVKAGYWVGRRLVARAREEFSTIFDGVRAEAPAGRILRALERAGREVLRGGQGADCICFCAFSGALVVSDERGNIRAGAITHQDRRSVAEAKLLCERLGKKWLLQHTGNLPYPGGIASSTLAWLQNHAPGVLRGRCRVGQISSVAGRLLTGEWVSDPSQAVFLGLWDIRPGKNAWNPRICAAVGVPADSLPRVMWADEIVGGLTAAMAGRWGLRAGTPVVGGFVDTSAAVIETPMQSGQLVHSTGSTDVLAMCVSEAAPAEGILSRPVGVGGGAFRESWLLVRTIAAAGSAIEWARQTLFSAVGEGAWRSALAAACRRSSLDGPVACVPAFAGERAAVEQMTGAQFSGVTLAARPEDLLDAIVRGLVKDRLQSYRMLAAIERPRKLVYAAGAGTSLQSAMHRTWPKGHIFRRWPSDNLRGLEILARRALGERPVRSGIENGGR